MGLCCCRRAFSSCGEWGLLFIAVASLVVEHGLQSTGSVVVAQGLSCSAACGTFPDQGTNLCPLHWQADSFFFFFFKGIPLFFYYLFIYLFLSLLGLRFCARAFSSCGKRGPLFIAVRGPLTIAASLVAEHRLQMRRLSSCGSRGQADS